LETVQYVATIIMEDEYRKSYVSVKERHSQYACVILKVTLAILRIQRLGNCSSYTQ